MTAKAVITKKRPPVDRREQSTDEPVFFAKFRGLKLRPEQLQVTVNCEVIVEVFKAGRSWYAQVRGATSEFDDIREWAPLTAIEAVERRFLEPIVEWQAYRRGKLVQGVWLSTGEFVEEPLTP